MSSPSATTSSPEPLTRSKCMRRHGYRRFYNRQQRMRHWPPLLWTFPGTGNTWMRMLLDYATGIYTGSIYGDPSLLPLLPGEGRCDRSVIALKAHPTHIDSMDMLRDPSPSAAAGSLPSFHLNVTRKPQYAKCASYHFRGAIVVMRDPYRAIWAEYKRLVNWREVVAGKASGKLGEAEKSRRQACKLALRAQSLHSGALLRACFDPGHFAYHATHLARSFKHAWFHYGRLKAVHNARLLVVSFEDLVDRQKREGVLREMVEFADARPKPTDDALRCAFLLADSPHIHRDRRAETSAAVVSIDDAFSNRTLVCQMWQLMRRRASRLGYKPFGGERCRPG